MYPYLRRQNPGSRLFCPRRHGGQPATHTEAKTLRTWRTWSLWKGPGERWQFGIRCMTLYDPSMSIRTCHGGILVASQRNGQIPSQEEVIKHWQTSPTWKLLNPGHFANHPQSCAKIKQQPQLVHFWAQTGTHVRFIESVDWSWGKVHRPWHQLAPKQEV